MLFKPPAQQLQQQAGANIVTAYPADPSALAVQLDRYGRVRFWLDVVLDGASTITQVKCKLQMRYNFGGKTTPWLDLPSYLDDVQGAAQPKGPTREIEHTLAVAAGAEAGLSFFLDDTRGIPDLALLVKADHVGAAPDLITSYASVCW